MIADKVKEEKCASWLGIPPAPEKTTLCRKNVNMMLDKLAKSLHDCCPLDSVAPHVPARLVDLGEDIDSVPRLVLRHTLQETKPSPYIKYAALSYCWGPESEIQAKAKTTRSVVPDRLDAIDLQHLPQSLLDAIDVCKVLSIRYLWIDMLCIVQDDPADFENEATDMARIYQNAYVTICALASESCTQGFLARTLESIEVPFQSQINPRIKGRYNMTYRANARCLLDVTGTHAPFQLDLESSEWNRRGWIFQEEYMSLRVLLFGKSRIYFRCRHRMYSENMAGYTRPYGDLLSSHVSDFMETIRTRKSVQILSEQWYGICSLFNKRRFTRFEDKLPALSGMAKYVADGVGDQFLVGLWRNSVILGLLWRITPTKHLREHLDTLSLPNPVNAPSWSWMVHNDYFELGTTSFYLDGNNKLIAECKICSTEISYASSSEFGRIDRAVLVVSGRMMPLSHHFVRYPVQNLTMTLWSLYHEGRPIYHCNLDWVDEAHVIHPPEALAMLKIASCPVYTRGKESKRNVVWGLLLMATLNATEYQRVGIFSSSWDVPDAVDLFELATMRTIRLV